MKVSETSTRVLIVDDDRRLLAALQLALAPRGYMVSEARDAPEALKAAEEEAPEVIILDVMMPGLDGFQLCRLMREKLSTPILMLTAKDSVPDRVKGLEAGADDYLIKPFAIDELVARLKALLRRQGVPSPASLIEYADLVLDRETAEVTRNGRVVNLRPMEFKILERLMQAPERIISRDELFESVWKQDDPVESNVVDVHIMSLRQKLEASGEPRLIHTIRGFGYMMRSDDRLQTAHLSSRG